MSKKALLLNKSLNFSRKLTSTNFYTHSLHPKVDSEFHQNSSINNAYHNEHKQYGHYSKAEVANQFVETLCPIPRYKNTGPMILNFSDAFPKIPSLGMYQTYSPHKHQNHVEAIRYQALRYEKP